MRKRQFEEIEGRIRSVCEERRITSLFVLTDANVNLLTDGFLPGVSRCVVAPGERSKTIEGASEVWNFLVSRKATRSSALVCVGGGMVTDLGGFAASTFKRGICCVNVPTTLLGAIDAAIGGKTGINFEGLKNEIGTFAVPAAVLPLTSLFDRLPEHEWLSGVGEALKTALLDSEELFGMASSEAFILKREPRIVAEVVGRCAAFKERIVNEDFREQGVRKILNLGHTAGHAIEALMMKRGTPVPHGIAVAYGLERSLSLSAAMLGLDGRLLDRYREILEKYFPKLRLEEKDGKELEEFMARDKKNRKAGVPAWVLLKKIGEPVTDYVIRP